jgi:hypothetical protein
MQVGNEQHKKSCKNYSAMLHDRVTQGHFTLAFSRYHTEKNCLNEPQYKRPVRTTQILKVSKT